MSRIILAGETPSIGVASATSAVNDPCDLVIGGPQALYLVEDGGSPLTLVDVWFYDPGNHPGEGPDMVTGLTFSTSLNDALDALAVNVRSFFGHSHDVHWPNGHVSVL